MNISSVCRETEYRKGIILITQGGEFRYIDHVLYPLIWETLLSRSVPRAESQHIFLPQNSHSGKQGILTGRIPFVKKRNSL